MPGLSVWTVRLALVNLVIGFTLGMLLLWNKGLFIGAWVWRLLPAHMELLLLGWTAQFILGVAFWILPRFGSARGNVKAAVAAVMLLNAGVWMVASAPLWPGAQWLPLWGRGLETGAALAFALHAWPRIKPPGG